MTLNQGKPNLSFQPGPVVAIELEQAVVQFRDRRGRPEDKLANLRTYLSPDYHRVINAYCTIGTERAWKEALDALDEEFGDQFQIRKVYIKELNDWPRVGNHDHG